MFKLGWKGIVYCYYCLSIVKGMGEMGISIDNWFDC